MIILLIFIYFKFILGFRGFEFFVILLFFCFYFYFFSLGIFPSNYVRVVPVGKTLWALSNYIGANKYELSISKRDRLKVLNYDVTT